jgi:hypothetical protein
VIWPGRPWLTRPTVAAGLLYAGCSVLFTFPLILGLGSRVPGQLAGDIPVNIWNLWWVREAVLSGADPLVTGHLFAPLGASLAFHALVLVKGLMALPLQLFVSPWTAYSILVMATLAMSATSMFALARYLTGSSAAALVAGLAYGFSPYMLSRGLGHLNYLSGEWMPAYILCLLRLDREPETRWALGAAAFLLLTAYSEYYYLIYLLLFTAALLAFRLVEEPRSLFRPAFAGRLLLMGGLVLGGFAPVLRAVLGADRSEFLYGGWSGSAKFGADLLAFVTPAPGSTLYGALGADAYTRYSGGNITEATVFTGFVVLGLALWAAVRLRHDHTVRFWSLVTVSFFLLSLGPVLHVDGQFVFAVGSWRLVIPLPYVLIHYLPLIKGARVPARFDVMTAMGLAVMASFAARELIQRSGRPRLAGGALALIIALEFLRVPYPTAAVDIPTPYYTIAQDTRDVAVLTVPLGWQTGWGCNGRCDSAQQIYQTVHGKRSIGGFVSRLPVRHLRELETLPVLPGLLALQERTPSAESATDARRGSIRTQLQDFLEHLPEAVSRRLLTDSSVRQFVAGAIEPPPRLAPTQASDPVAAGARLIARTDLGYVLVHAPYVDDDELMAHLHAALPLELVERTDQLACFRVVTPPAPSPPPPSLP